MDGIFKAMLDRYFTEGAALDLGTDPVAGRMLTQPEVVGVDGNTQLLDEFLGRGFALIGVDCDPAVELDNAVLAPWRKLGARVVALGVHETLGAHGSWLMDLLSRSEGNMFLVRPDRFCMASFTLETAAEKLGRAASMLGLARAG